MFRSAVRRAAHLWPPNLHNPIQIIPFLNSFSYNKSQLLSKPPILNNLNLFQPLPRSFSRVTEAAEAASSTDAYEVEEMMQERLQKLNKAEAVDSKINRKLQRSPARMGKWKYHALQRRQMKIETEAWEQAAKEYKVLKKLIN